MNLNVTLKATSILWVIWGIVHVLFGVLIISGDAAFGIQAIGNGVEYEDFAYPDTLAAIMNQHGWNLVWFGAVTMIGGVYIWKGSNTAIWISALIGGLADLGYFIFLDLGGYVKFFPGTLMTIIALTAILLGLYSYTKGSNQKLSNR